MLHRRTCLCVFCVTLAAAAAALLWLNTNQASAQPPAKPVSFTGIALTGTDAGNYTPNATASTTADITRLALLVSAAGVNKPYDGNVVATVNLIDNRLSGDALTAVYSSALFANKNVGTAKSISVTGIALTGSDALNYTPNTTASATADIAAFALTVGSGDTLTVSSGQTSSGVIILSGGSEVVRSGGVASGNASRATRTARQQAPSSPERAKKPPELLGRFS